MLNREKILQTNTYDFLYEMNEKLHLDYRDACVMDALIGQEKRNKRCYWINKEDGYLKCDACIMHWLNEEVE